MMVALDVFAMPPLYFPIGLNLWLTDLAPLETRVGVRGERSAIYDYFEVYITKYQNMSKINLR